MEEFTLKWGRWNSPDLTKGGKAGFPAKRRELATAMKNNVAGRHVRTLSQYNLKASLRTGGCGKCQAACQSACKTSCTVGNIVCENKQ